MNIKAIAEGISNRKRDDELTQYRADICAKCTHAKPTFLASNAPNYRQLKGVSCDICNCILSLKVKQDVEKCPKGYW